MLSATNALDVSLLVHRRCVLPMHGMGFRITNAFATNSRTLFATSALGRCGLLVLCMKRCVLPMPSQTIHVVVCVASALGVSLPVHGRCVLPMFWMKFYTTLLFIHYFLRLVPNDMD